MNESSWKQKKNKKKKKKQSPDMLPRPIAIRRASLL
jgi:hypothetical protein